MKAWWLRHAFGRKPPPSDTRPFIVRLASSLQLVVRGTIKKGINFIGIRGGAEF